MKKLIPVICAAVLLAACGSENDKGSSDKVETTAATTSATTAETTTTEETTTAEEITTTEEPKEPDIELKVVPYVDDDDHTFGVETEDGEIVCWFDYSLDDVNELSVSFFMGSHFEDYVYVDWEPDVKVVDDVGGTLYDQRFEFDTQSLMPRAVYMKTLTVDLSEGWSTVGLDVTFRLDNRGENNYVYVGETDDVFQYHVDINAQDIQDMQDW